MIVNSHSLEKKKGEKESISTDGSIQSGSLRKSGSSSLSLAELLYQRLQLEDAIVSQDGEITDTQDVIWQNQELAIKDKVDAYGYVLTEIESELEKLKMLKREASERISNAINRSQSNIERLKRRLNFLSEGSPLRGHIYSFHPYISVRRSVEDINLVETHLVNLTIEITEANWQSILSSAYGSRDPRDIPEYKILKREAKVSQLPEIHPAVKSKITASVRVS